MGHNLRYLAVHGLGDQRGHDWHGPWKSSIENPFASFALGNKTPALEAETYEYDHIFQNLDLSLGETTRALTRLVGSGITSGFDSIADWLRGSSRSRSNERSLDQTIRWTAGYVVAWLEDEGFRSQTRQDIQAKLKQHRPQILLAHSLGSLVTYDALTHPSTARDPEL
ncbi:MAG: hypothetical protein AAGC74_09285 [Verrucomicrobiota bacterium]